MFTCQADPAPPLSCACCQPQLRTAAGRMARDFSRRGFMAGATGSFAALGLAGRARAQEPPAPPIVLRNFQLFDGKSLRARGGMQVLVEGDRIKQVTSGDASAPQGAQIIDCGGGTLMPGLIDAHWHTMFAGLPVMALMSADIGYIFLAASAEAERTLMRGFTTVRDLGGPAFALKQAIDEGLAVGPRIYPCGAMITSTGGHGDLRPVSDLPRKPGVPSYVESTGAANIADSADEVRLRVREQLIQGASHIKMIGGGGVSSPRTTLDMATFSEAEFRAGTEAAADRGTYVAVHAYPPAQIQRAISAGARCIEHGHLMDEATARIMADKGVWLSTQPFVSEEDNAPVTGQSRINLLQVLEGTDTVYSLAKRLGVKTAFGSDLLFSPQTTRLQGRLLSHLSRWHSGAEALGMATAGNGELLAMSGPMNPYRGKLGVIEPGAFADMILVAGDPTANLALVADPETNFKLIMKGGRVFKDARAAA